MADLLAFPARAVRKPPPVPDEVAVQFDFGRWSVVLLAEGRLARRRVYLSTRAECVEQARQISERDGVSFHVEREIR